MSMLGFFEFVTTAFEVLGVAAMVIGIVVAVVLSFVSWVRQRDGRRAFTTLRETIGLSILLGLEILVAADLVKTVTSSPSLTDAAVLAIIVLLRTVLSFSLQVEIEGVVPWRRAFVTSPQLIADRLRSTPGRDSASASTEP
jgi:uncharacterized membrane protein